MENSRELWSNKIGFILATAGSAVGLGNVWRFPYLVGMNGGAAFVIVYVVLALSVGISIMLAEFCLGRATRRNVVGAMRVLTKNPIWHIAAWCGMIAGGGWILSYYGIIAGWTLRYMFHSLTDLMPLALEGSSGAVLGGFLNQTSDVVMYQVAAMAITTIIVALGISSGIERACKVLMPVLFILLLILIVRAVTLPGAAEGVKFYLEPDFSKLTGESVLAALGQGFYSLSVGMGILVTYASYIRKEENLVHSGLFVLCVDTLVALLAGLVIFPAVFAMGVEPSAGVGLTFITLPGVFAQMPGGAYFSCAFFTLLLFAAITSMISLLEVAVSFIMDELHMSRSISSIISGVLITLLGIPSAMSLADDSKVPQIFGMSFFDFMDSAANYIMMPICAMGISIFVGWIWYSEAKKEITNDGTLKFQMMGLWMLSIRFFAPAMIGLIMVTGWPF